jgi:hypothetical protein
MASTKIYIRDVNLLEELQDRIVSSGEAMSGIDRNVVSSLDSVMSTLESNLAIVRQKLESAESRLSNAEAALAACESQVIMTTMGPMPPDCGCEQSEVAAANAEVSKWKGRYERGQQIVSECRSEIAEYNSTTGGHGLIVNMTENQTPKASMLLSDCLARLQDILNANMQ